MDSIFFNTLKLMIYLKIANFAFTLGGPLKTNFVLTDNEITDTVHQGFIWDKSDTQIFPKPFFVIVASQTFLGKLSMLGIVGNIFYRVRDFPDNGVMNVIDTRSLVSTHFVLIGVSQHSFWDHYFFSFIVCYFFMLASSGDNSHET